MNLRSWAVKWGVPLDAVAELEAPWGVSHAPVPSLDDAVGSEARQQSLIVLEGGRQGIPLLRNNVGALKDMRGVPVRYGLANETKERNKQLKSSDLIGIRPVLITPAHVGQTIGQFLSLEVKEQGWQFKGDAHENAQLNWHKFVMRFGGESRFIVEPGDL